MFLGPEKYQPSLDSIYKGLGIMQEQVTFEMPKMYDFHLPVKKLHEDSQLPFKKNYWDAGFDLYAYEDARLEYGIPVKMKTGIAMAIPNGYVGIIEDRSGVGSKGVQVMTHTIDATYRGEIIVCLMYSALVDNYPALGLSAPYIINKNDRIAQIVLYKIPQVGIIEVPELNLTDRGDGGFGSTGV